MLFRREKARQRAPGLFLINQKIKKSSSLAQQNGVDIGFGFADG
jgi:hypothetical protein